MRGRLALVAAVLVAGCSGTDVQTDSAAQVTTLPPATVETVPPTSTQLQSDPAMPGPPASTVTPPGAGTPAPTLTPSPEEASTSAGDSLFADLGSDDLDVQSYDVRVGYDPETTTIAGVVTITTLIDRPLAQVALDAAELVVDSVRIDSAAATFEQTPTDLVITPAAPVGPGTPVVIEVVYHDAEHESEPGFGLGSGWYPTPGGSYVLNEPDGAHRWLPSNDTPSDKATWHFEVTVPAGVTAVANGHLVAQQPVPKGSTWIWDQTQPMATYLVQLLIGDYEVLDGGLAGDTPLTNVALRADAERMQPYFQITSEQVAFFETLFGPYPLDTYGLAFADSVPGLAMETQGRSMFARTDFTGSLDDTAHLLLSHELAHQWFGDAVTPADWSDLWLNESFATYGQWLWMQHVGILDLDAEAAAVLQLRQVPTEPTAEPTVDDLFGFERYDGGAVVLHALRLEIGDDAFFTLLQRWVAENVGMSRTTTDFTTLASAVAGRDLTDFFAAWLYAPSLPATFPG